MERFRGSVDLSKIIRWGFGPGRQSQAEAIANLNSYNMLYLSV